jgi:hypothetical protein
MRSTSLSLGIGLVLAGAFGGPLGCSETPAPVAPAQPTASVAAEPPPAPVDLSPVAEPAGVFVTARWKNPNATLSGIGSCAGVGADLVDTSAKKLLDSALGNAFRGGVDGKQIAAAVALDAPIDLLVSIDAERRGAPGVLFAFSIGLNSLERAKSALTSAGPLEEVVPGLWRVGVKEGGDLTCVIGPAAGAAPARLICGQHDKDVAALAPYLARNVPLAAPAAQDVHAELHFAPVEARFGADLRRGLTLLPGLARMQGIGEPRYDRALVDGASALADEGTALLGDLDRISFDLGVDGTSCLNARGALDMRSKNSWIAGLVAERGDKSGPPPPIFWRAPRDSASASYGRGTDVARYDGIFRVLRGLLEGKLAKEQIGSDADRKALAGLVTLPLGKDTNVVVASGHLQGAPAPAAAGSVPKEQMADAILNSYVGWYLLGFDEGPAALSKMMKDLVGVYGRKGLIDPLRKALGHDADKLPTARLVAAPAQLGRGALDLELVFDLPKKGETDAKKDAKKKGGSFVLHVLLMGDGQSTWLAVGANRDELVKRLVAVKTGAPDTGTLATRQGLEPLRAGKALSSGFLTLETLTRPIGNLLGSPAMTQQAAGKASLLADITNTLNNLPHKGETPIFLTSTATAAGPRSEFALNMQRGSFEDLGAIVLTTLRIINNAGQHP